MKHQFTKVALLAVLGLAATGCQKADDMFPTTRCEQTSETIQVTYSINGEIYHVTIAESEWDAFLERMLALAREGYEVSFSRNGLYLTSQCKEKVVFVTTKANEASAWAEAMTNEGYTVSITFDKVTGEYTCIAIK